MLIYEYCAVDAARSSHPGTAVRALVPLSPAAVTQRSAAGAARLLVAMGGPALRWTPLSTAATGEPFGAVFEERPIAEIIASSALRDEMSVCPRLCSPAVNSVR